MHQALKIFWETSYRLSTELPNRPTSSRERETNNTYYQWMNRKQRDQQDTTDELERYLNEPVLPSDPTDMSAIQWWIRPEQQQRFPLLSKITIDVFSIPSMLSEPERVFSGVKHTITDQRHGLKSDTIEILEYLKSWFNIGLYTDGELHTILASCREHEQQEELRP